MFVIPHISISLYSSICLKYILLLKGKVPCTSIDLQGTCGTQTRYNAVKTRETKRIYYIDNQLFIIFLYLVILPFFACFLLDSTL